MASTIETGESVATLLERPGVRIERIESLGHVTPEGQYYDQSDDEWVFVAEGAARLWLADRGEIALNAGDHLLIPAHCRHRVTWTDPDRATVWIAVFVTPSGRGRHLTNTVTTASSAACNASGLRTSDVPGPLSGERCRPIHRT